jgi:superfamily I DNA/RNA helicase
MFMPDDYHKADGPLLLLAGPGTGKTYRLAKRIKYLVEEKNVSSDEIAVITFTSAAARNMHERISDPTREELYVAHDLQPKMICTMHSLGHRIIGEKASDLGFTEDVTVLYSDKVREIIMGDAAQLCGYLRADGAETMHCRQIGQCIKADTKKCKICDTYQKILRSCSAVDHDDQILLACHILQNNADVLETYKSKCKHLLVDEYQDINAGQFELIKILADEQRNGLFVVGDDDQSIYSWRGGSPEYIRSFKKHFGASAKVEALLKSFRCRPHVLEGSLAVVSKYDRNRLAKGTFEYKETEGSKVIVHSVPSDEKEAKIIRKIIHDALPSRSVLVLIPTKYFSREIIKELKKSKIKYTAPLKVPGAGLPLIMTLAGWLANNNDSLALRECIDAFIESPSSGMPSKRVKKPEKIQAREDVFLHLSKLWKALLDRSTNSLWKSLRISKDSNDICKNICDVFEEIKSIYDNAGDPAIFMAKTITNFAPWKKIQNLLDEIDSWIETSDRLDNTGQGMDVELMTFQGAKGLEADVVCVIGLEDGVLPQKDISDDQLAEQSRLMFVTMTRAIEELHLFHARTRSASVMLRPVYKKGKTPDISMSCFIDSIPNEHKEDKYHGS